MNITTVIQTVTTTTVKLDEDFILEAIADAVQARATDPILRDAKSADLEINLDYEHGIVSGATVTLVKETEECVRP